MEPGPKVCVCCSVLLCVYAGMGEDVTSHINQEFNAACAIQQIVTQCCLSSGPNGYMTACTIAVVPRCAVNFNTVLHMLVSLLVLCCYLLFFLYPCL